MEALKLYMVIIGCTPPGRFTEQHDVFFGIGASMKSLIPAMKAFWPEAKGKIHVDAWREVSNVEGHAITVIPNDGITEANHQHDLSLFFLNLGGYKEGEFEEYHYKMLAVAKDAAAAIKEAKKTTFYKHTGYKGAESHVDDKYGIDVDDIYLLKDILNQSYKQQYRLFISEEKEVNLPEDVLNIGYYKLDKL
ncbi:DUF1543 domain-containing protein [Taibaiella lutea]|uniref:DUF1543 domain-containing protein n=1 Tax=Taibaiella lutea TaxID=2608001 RepID=A0A5M6CD36_9BACT|nr:DUF1543 domain-containing protein [Taibaiella lutea]KAA5532370.1 DUF1543 domain-containing protein [Taibaiella lutea]